MKQEGIVWALLIYFTSAINDVLMKLLGNHLHFIEISFFRFLFSVLVLLPILLSKPILLKTTLHKFHLLRGIIGSVALCLCCLSVNILPLAENTIVLFSEALFIFPLSRLFLRENIETKSIIATCIGFLGLLIVFRPNTNNINYYILIPTLAAFLFAVLDILAKKMVNQKENNITMLFSFGLYATIISGFFLRDIWQAPTYYELFLILLLGIGGNLIQLFLFLAYKKTNATNIAPIRYTEVLFSGFFGYSLFHQVPCITDTVGAILIILSTLFLTKA